MSELSSKVVISVVVATYNRAELIPGCIESLKKQHLDRDLFEVIVVDNHSTDDTYNVASQCVADERNFRLVKELVQGASSARNRGMRESIGRYIAYMDDDAKASQNWLVSALKVIEAESPAIFGGPIYPFYRTQVPAWFLDKYEIRMVRDTPGELDSNQYISGSNITFNKALLESLGGFDVTLGPQGEQFSYGEETELIKRAREKLPNCKVYYDPDVSVKHLGPPHKMRIGYFIKRPFSWGLCNVDIFGQTREVGPMSYLKMAKLVLWSFILTLGGFLFRNRTRYPYWQHYFIENIAPKAAEVGSLIAHLRVARLTSQRGKSG